MEFGMSNVETDEELNIKARSFILDRACRKYLERGDPTFTANEIQLQLQGLGPRYATIQTWENWAQSGFVDIDENNNLTLNERGKEECRKKKLLL